MFNMILSFLSAFIIALVVMCCWSWILKTVIALSLVTVFGVSLLMILCPAVILFIFLVALFVFVI